MGALEKMAERNSMLSDRVERLLEAMEARGASTSEIATKRTELEAQIGEVLEEVSAEVTTEAEPVAEEVQTIAAGSRVYARAGDARGDQGARDQDGD